MCRHADYKHLSIMVIFQATASSIVGHRWSHIEQRSHNIHNLQLSIYEYKYLMLCKCMQELYYNNSLSHLIHTNIEFIIDMYKR